MLTKCILHVCGEHSKQTEALQVFGRTNCEAIFPEKPEAVKPRLSYLLALITEVVYDAQRCKSLCTNWPHRSVPRDNNVNVGGDFAERLRKRLLMLWTLCIEPLSLDVSHTTQLDIILSDSLLNRARSRLSLLWSYVCGTLVSNLPECDFIDVW